jgi:hypothetical protein
MKAFLYAVSTTQGVQGSFSFTLSRHQDLLACKECRQAYYLDYDPADISSSTQGTNQLISMAQTAINGSHPNHPSTLTLR